MTSVRWKVKDGSEDQKTKEASAIDEIGRNRPTFPTFDMEFCPINVATGCFLSVQSRFELKRIQYMQYLDI